MMLRKLPVLPITILLSAPLYVEADEFDGSGHDIRFKMPSGNIYCSGNSPDNHNTQLPDLFCIILKTKKHHPARPRLAV